MAANVDDKSWIGSTDKRNNLNCTQQQLNTKKAFSASCKTKLTEENVQASDEMEAVDIGCSQDEVQHFMGKRL